MVPIEATDPTICESTIQTGGVRHVLPGIDRDESLDLLTSRLVERVGERLRTIARALSAMLHP